MTVVPANAAPLPRITGRIVDQAGAPIEGVEIRVDTQDGSRAVTATDGTFTLYAPSGQSINLLTAERLEVGAWPEAYYSGLTVRSSSFTVSGDVDAGDLVYPRSTLASVKFVDRDGDPVVGVSLSRDCQRWPVETQLPSCWEGPKQDFGSVADYGWSNYYVELLNVRPAVVELLAPATDDGLLPPGLEFTYTAADGAKHGYTMSEAVRDSDGYVLHMDDVDVSAPDAPGQVRANSADASAIVSWTAPADNGGSPVTSYTVTASPGGTSVTVPGDATSAEVRGLENGVAYAFTVTAANAVGPSPASQPSTPTTPAGAPDAPVVVSVDGGNQQAEITWAQPSSNGSPITGYTIIGHPGGLATTVSGADTLSTVVEGLTNGRAYTFAVIATNAVGSGPASARSAAVTPATTPGRVVKPAVEVDGRRALIKWTAPVHGGSSIRGYRVTVNDKNWTTGPRARKLALKNLKPGRYQVKVAALNGVGTGPTSAIARFRIRRD